MVVSTLIIAKLVVPTSSGVLLEVPDGLESLGAYRAEGYGRSPLCTRACRLRFLAS